MLTRPNYLPPCLIWTLDNTVVEKSTFGTCCHMLVIKGFSVLVTFLTHTAICDIPI